MIIKNKSNTFAFKIENYLSGDCGKEIVLIPSIIVYWNEGIFTFDIIIFFISFEFWFGDIEGLS